jgi:hypothetical protein
MCEKTIKDLEQCFPNCWLRKITTDPYILGFVDVNCPDDRYHKLKKKLYSELILDR